MAIPFLPSRSVADAERYARSAHADQVDKAEQPYVEHLKRVSVRAMSHWVDFRAGTTDEDLDALCQIAWLHDVIEDTGHTAADLRAEGFANGVVGSVEYLSNNAPVLHTYVNWIQSLCLYAPLPVLIVKLADVEDNRDPFRLALLPVETRGRLERKYVQPLRMLWAAVNERAK